MRKRFDGQLRIGQVPISGIKIKPRKHNALEELLAALVEIYSKDEYKERIFSILENILCGRDKNNGRPGMDLWSIFVLSQVRMCMDFSYEDLLHQANNDIMLRQVMGVEFHPAFEGVEFEYQNIYDNVNLLTDNILKEINEVIVEFGQREVFKKKEGEALRLKTDSFVVESNVHFPTDYNLLWDCLRKCLDTVDFFIKKYSFIDGWRKIKNWRKELKSLMREVGRISGGGGKKKDENLRKAAHAYLSKSRLLLQKLTAEKGNFPIADEPDLVKHLELEHYMQLLIKHIDLVERRILKGEIIPHEEKMFSIFEPYTEWITKGKLRPNVELGKKVAITTDCRHLIVAYRIMNHEQDRDIVIGTADRLLQKYVIDSWSFDKGFWDRDNRDLLRLEIKDVIMPKLGKLSGKDREIEESPIFKRLKNKHSAVESNINELEHRGLDRCPDRGEAHFNRYVGMAVCAYNLKKTGRTILKQRLEEAVSRRKAAA